MQSSILHSFNLVVRWSSFWVLPIEVRGGAFYVFSHEVAVAVLEGGFASREPWVAGFGDTSVEDLGHVWMRTSVVVLDAFLGSSKCLGLK